MRYTGKWNMKPEGTDNMRDSESKYQQLLGYLRNLGNAAIAFSGGVDSTFLLAAARLALGDKVLALTVKTPYIPDWELEEAIAFCKKEGIQHRIIHARIIKEIMQNPKNRCYICKRYVFSTLKDEAAREGFTNLLDGTNADDTEDYRPGLVALEELAVKSPLLLNRFSKKDIRKISRQLNLNTADKPSYACLLTRLPYDHEVTTGELSRIEKAEVYLGKLGYRASRVRSHGTVARIELEKESIREFIDSQITKKIVVYFKSLGYDFVTLDLEGYRTGSFNTTINKNTK